MYPYFNEEVAWQRLQDVQREMENTRLMAQHGPTAVAHLARYIGGRVWGLVVSVRPVRRRQPLAEECESASEVA
jgi:hypothetical protein